MFATLGDAHRCAAQVRTRGTCRRLCHTAKPAQVRCFRHYGLPRLADTTPQSRLLHRHRRKPATRCADRSLAFAAKPESWAALPRNCRTRSASFPSKLGGLNRRRIKSRDRRYVRRRIGHVPLRLVRVRGARMQHVHPGPLSGRREENAQRRPSADNCQQEICGRSSRGIAATPRAILPRLSRVSARCNRA